MKLLTGTSSSSATSRPACIGAPFVARGGSGTPPHRMAAAAAAAVAAPRRQHPRLQPCRAAADSPEPATAEGATAAAAAAAAAEPAAATTATTTTTTTTSSSQSPSSSSLAQPTTQQQRRAADSTDPIASALSRRFGLAGGLAWLGVLAVGSLGEQVKTRLEVAAEASNTRDVAAAAEVALPSGVRFTDSRVGGGQAPQRGFLVVVDYVGRVAATGEVFEDTKRRGKPIVFLYGTRPFAGGMCAGVEEAMATMRAGGRRTVRVPPALAFGERGAVLRPTEHVPDKQGIVPGGQELEYELELLRVSIPPS